MYIYKITNNLNNKIYIGLKTSTVKESESYYGSGVAINRAIDKYGKHNFTKTILERDIVDYDLLKEREQYWIEYYDSYNNGYNMTLGGDGTLGHIVSDETKEKIRKAFKGKKIGPYSDERKAAIKEGRKNGKSNKGVKKPPRTEEHTKNLSKALKGRPMHPNTRKALLESITGRVVSEETRKKISEANSGVPFTKERCERIRKALKGRKMSDEMKQKIKDAKAREPRRTCIHCGLEGKGANMTRYHFDNCKQKS